MSPSVNDKIRSVVDMQKKADQLEQTLKEEYPDVWEQLDEVKALREQAERDKNSLKLELVANKDFGNYQTEGFNVSVSQTVKLAVKDEAKITSDFIVEKPASKEVDLQRATEFYTMTKTLPAGFEDKSIYRLNWRPIKNRSEEA